ncbi:MAG TPA: hypothetical protein VJI12_03945 [archaeon]|nr:hypothetical protein [archaeon]
MTVYEILRDRDTLTFDKDVAAKRTARIAGIAADFFRRIGYDVEYVSGSTNFSTREPIKNEDRNTAKILVDYPYSISDAA